MEILCTKWISRCLLNSGIHRYATITSLRWQTWMIYDNLLSFTPSPRFRVFPCQEFIHTDQKTQEIEGISKASTYLSGCRLHSSIYSPVV